MDHLKAFAAIGLLLIFLFYFKNPGLCGTCGKKYYGIDCRCFWDR